MEKLGRKGNIEVFKHGAISKATHGVINGVKSRVSFDADRLEDSESSFTNEIPLFSTMPNNCLKGRGFGADGWTTSKDRSAEAWGLLFAGDLDQDVSYITDVKGAMPWRTYQRV